MSIYQDSIFIENVLTFGQLIGILFLAPVLSHLIFITTAIYMVFCGLHVISFASVYEGELTTAITWGAYQKYVIIAVITFTGGLLN